MQSTPPLSTPQQTNIQSVASRRIDFVDLAKCFSILIVVVSHIYIDFARYDGKYMPYGDFFYTFFMPLFFLLSGMFFKDYGSFKKFAIRKTNTLLVPFLFFYLITCVLPVFVLNPMGITLDGANDASVLWAFLNQRTLTNGPLWFLLCLFWMNLMFYAVMLVATKLSKDKMVAKVSLLVSLSLLCGIIGFVLGQQHLHLWMFSDTALSCLPFFCMGYILRKFTNILYPGKWDKYLLLLVGLLAAVTYVLRGGMDWYVNDPNAKSMLRIYLGGLAGTMMVLFLAKSIGRLPLLSYWGRYSLVILCTHFPIAQAISYYMYSFGLEDSLGHTLCITLCLAAVMLLCTALIPLGIRFVPWFTAQKDLIKIQ